MIQSAHAVEKGDIDIEEIEKYTSNVCCVRGVERKEKTIFSPQPIQYISISLR
jgi:hypothetical protein